MTTLITGAGLIAAFAAAELQRRGEAVVLFDLCPASEYLETVMDVKRAVLYQGEITELDALIAIAKKHRVERVIHTAGLIGAQVSNHPIRGINVNVNGSMVALEAARQAGVKRFIFCSSMAIFDFDKLPQGAQITEDAPTGPKNLYAATKLATELLLNQYSLLYGIDVIHLRLAGVFGRGQFVGGSWMGRILNRMLEASLTKQEVVIRAEWLGVNEYVYVKDVAHAFASAALADTVPAGAFNIGTGVLHDTKALVEEILRVAPDCEIRLEGLDALVVPYLQRNQPFDISKAKKQLAYEPQYSLGAGLSDYLDELRRYRGCYERLG